MNRKIGIIVAVVVVIIFVWILLPKGNTTIEPKDVDIEIVDNNLAAPKINADELYSKAVSLKKDRNLVDSKEIYQKIITEVPDYENIEIIQKDLESINMDLLFSNVVTKDTVTHVVEKGDTLGILAKKYGTTIDLIKKKNNLKNNIIRIGQKLVIWTSPFNIYVDKSQNILMLKNGDEIIKIYRVSTGENNSTPVGEFKVATKLVDPVWFNRGVIVPPESPENALGSRWMGFDIQGYGIHGTIEPETIGQQITAGCVRMRNEEVEELYGIITLGTIVKIVD